MHRVAIYFAPHRDSRWWEFGSRWLGRDAALLPSAGPHTSPDDRIIAPGWSTIEWQALVSAPARYGWHATLKAPFRLAAGIDPDTLHAAIDAVARQTPSTPIGTIEARHLGSTSAGVVALVATRQSEQLADLASACVTELDRLRAPLDDADRARRDPAALDARGRELLERYGYPQVLERFRFHMTLTGALPRDAAAPILDIAQGWADRLQSAEPLVLDRLSLFVEPSPGATFERRADFELRGMTHE